MVKLQKAEVKSAPKIDLGMLLKKTDNTLPKKFKKRKAEMSTDEKHRRRVQVVYNRATQEKQIFMDDLKVVRQYRIKKLLKKITAEVGPKWYHAFSVLQEQSLDNLDRSIYQDLINGRPLRTMQTLKVLDLYRLPTVEDIFTCVYIGRNDPKEFLAALHFIMLGHPFDDGVVRYSLNAKLILSAILYLGLGNLLDQLRERFKPDPIEPPHRAKPKSITPRPKSPYLEKFKAICYTSYKPDKRRRRPPPLPNLDELKRVSPIVPAPLYRPPSPPTPPPPPKKRLLPVSYCEKLAEIKTRIEQPDVGPETKGERRRTIIQSIKPKIEMKSEIVPKKKYGIGIAFRKPRTTKKPVLPRTSMASTRLVITGVYTINMRSYYIIGSISISAGNNDIIHGGHKMMDNEYIFINLGLRAKVENTQENKACDCLKKWQNPVMKHLKESKCKCGHHYDYYNKGPFPKKQPLYFKKPTPTTRFSFDYSAIMELEPRIIHIENEMRKIYEKESVLNIDNPEFIRKQRNKTMKEAQTNCLGPKPNASDYLKCALKMMVHVNMAARLPDVHLVPELREWMRRRLRGPLTRHQKALLTKKSARYWSMFKTLELDGFWHVTPPENSKFRGLSDWKDVPMLRNTYWGYSNKYKRDLYRKMAILNNLFWTSMCQAQFPSRRFREIYFDYIIWRFKDLLMVGCYSPRETNDRLLQVSKLRRYCIIKGMEPSIGGEKMYFMK